MMPIHPQGDQKLLQFGIISRDRSRSSKKYKRKALLRQNLKIHDEQFAFYSDPCASNFRVYIPTDTKKLLRPAPFAGGLKFAT